MKTFETEKHNIPEGATHFSDECENYHFTWFAEFTGGEVYLFSNSTKEWKLSLFNRELKPIPQTNIETPEEKEALDLIDTTPHQYEMSKFSGNEWNGEGLPAVGVECEAIFIEHEHKGYGKFLILGYHGDYVWMEYIGELSNKSKHYTAKVDMVKFRKPKTEAERAECEKLEAAYDLYLLRCHAVNHPITYEFHKFKSEPDAANGWLAIVDKTNYRKESE